MKSSPLLVIKEYGELRVVLEYEHWLLRAGVKFCELLIGKKRVRHMPGPEFVTMYDSVYISNLACRDAKGERSFNGLSASYLRIYPAIFIVSAHIPVSSNDTKI